MKIMMHDEWLVFTELLDGHEMRTFQTEERLNRYVAEMVESAIEDGTLAVKVYKSVNLFERDDQEKLREGEA